MDDFRHQRMAVMLKNSLVAFTLASMLSAVADPTTIAYAPDWTSLLGSQVGSTPSSAAGLFHVGNLARDRDPMVPFGTVDVDVTEQVRAALSQGASHILFHSWLKDVDHAMNFG